MADLPLIHIRLAEPPLSLQLACESGDIVSITVLAGCALVSVDDVDKTLPGPDGEATVPTIKLTLDEARSFSRWLDWALQRPPITAP